MSATVIHYATVWHWTKAFEPATVLITNPYHGLLNPVISAKSEAKKSRKKSKFTPKKKKRK